MNLSQVVVENSLLLSSIIIKENDHIVLLAEEEEGLRGIKNFGNKKNFGIKSFGITFPPSRKTYLNVPKAREDLLYYVGQREVVLHENTILFFFNPDPSNCSMHSFLVAMSCGLEEKY